MTKRNTATKLYVTALAIAWTWALVLSAAGVYYCVVPPRREPAGASEVYLASKGGFVSTVDRDLAAMQQEFGERPATPQEIHAYLHPKPDYETGLGLMIIGFIVPTGLIAGNRWWRWLRKPERVRAEHVRFEADRATNGLPPVEPSPKDARARPSVDGRLAELKQLFDRGLITQEEYSKKRTELISKL
jgi:hypothetical protein